MTAAIHPTPEMMGFFEDYVNRTGNAPAHEDELLIVRLPRSDRYAPEDFEVLFLAHRWRTDLVTTLKWKYEGCRVFAMTNIDPGRERHARVLEAVAEGLACIGPGRPLTYDQTVAAAEVGRRRYREDPVYHANVQALVSRILEVL